MFTGIRLSLVRGIAGTGFIAAAATISSGVVFPLSAQEAAPPVSAPACEADEFRAFDFWIGEWIVSNVQTGEKAGENRITSLHGGCGFLESWTGTDGSTGTSLTYFNPLTEKWVQRWVSGSYGGYALALEGGPERPGRMVLSGMAHYYARKAAPRMRLIWQADGENALTQTFQRFDEEQGVWADWFVASYKRK